MKIALVHDDLVQEGGAERLFDKIAQIYSGAPIYTSIFNPDKLPTGIGQNRIRPSWMEKIPGAVNFFKELLPLYSIAFESFNFDEFDLVISSTTRFAKGLITKPKTAHICYLNSVPRFLYNQESKNQYLSNIAQAILAPYFDWLKRWDMAASARPDFYIANSKNVQEQIKKIYNRESTVVYPAADTEYFKVRYQKGQKYQGYQMSEDRPEGKYYLVVSRLVKWKRIDIAIEACQALGVNLKIVGSGPDGARLKSANSTWHVAGGQKKENRIGGRSAEDGRSEIEFIANATREELRNLYQNAKALIVTQEEDFGIAMVEAQACGTPVVAYGAGGAREIVIGGETGTFFTDQTPESAKDAIKRASKVKWNQSVCRKNALRFTEAIFKKKLEAAIDEYVKKIH